MLKRGSVVLMFLISMTILGKDMAFSQTYPNKPVRIVAAEIGGGGDFTARQIAQRLTGPLGQPVIVDNRPSATLGAIVSNATPDGYTLLIAGDSFWTGSLIRRVSYDPVRDFSPITMISSAPLVLVVPPSLPVKSVKELIDLAKSRPGMLNYAAAGVGGAVHLAAELFKAMSGTNIVYIQYKGSGQAIIDVIGGQVHLMFAGATASMPHVTSGKLRPLGITSPEPSILFPGLPTVAATGLPGFSWIGIDGVWAPTRTPAAIINRLNQEIVRILNSAEVKQKLIDTRAEAAPSSPEQLDAIIKSAMAKTAKVIKDAGIKVE